MILGNKQNTSFVLNIDGKTINNFREIELPGIVIDNQLKFKKHIKNLCKKASFKLHALHRIRKFLTVEKAKSFGNAFIKRQLSYAPLIWMFASKTAINNILKIHYKTLQVVYSEYYKSYENLLPINKDISIHQKYLRIMYFNPEFMWHCFKHLSIDFFSIPLIDRLDMKWSLLQKTQKMRDFNRSIIRQCKNPKQILTSPKDVQAFIKLL